MVKKKNSHLLSVINMDVVFHAAKYGNNIYENCAFFSCKFPTVESSAMAVGVLISSLSWLAFVIGWTAQLQNGQHPTCSHDFFLSDSNKNDTSFKKMH